MAVSGPQSMLHGEITCGSLLQQLQKIWDEVGESDEERDKMLLQLEQECLDVYKRKVDQAENSRAHLLQSLDDSKSEFENLLSSLGDNSCTSMDLNSSGTINEQLAAIAPALKHLRKQKEERIMEFADIQSQIQKICSEISGNLKQIEQVGTPTVDESDLSLKKLDEFQTQLRDLQKEKSDRLHKVLDLVSTVHDLCAILGMDFFSTITEVHPSLNESVGMQLKSISNDTLSKLVNTVIALREDKKLRLEKVQELAVQLTDLWNLMDTPEEERRLFDHVTCNISTGVDEVTTPRALAFDLIEQAEVEVERLDQLKASKMKEIAMKKQAELEDIYARAHIEIDSMAAQVKIVAVIDSGTIEPHELLADMDDQILKAKEEALSRKEILEKVERWMSACEEEIWLEDYNRDENRYNASRGAHLNLKRAEKARVLVNKIPALVDILVSKTRTWEEEHDMSFMYDGVPLLAMMDEYLLLRQEREEEKRRTRDQKKYGEQSNSEQDSASGSRPSPNRPLVGPKKVVGARANGAASSSNGTPPGRRLSLQSSGNRSMSREANKRDGSRLLAPVNHARLPNEDAVSHEPAPATP